MIHWYLLGGEDGRTPIPCEMMEWASVSQLPGMRRVKQSMFGEVMVSTIFLGLDHRWGEGPPILFESLVFGGPLDGEMVRYCTYDEAEAGHADLCEQVEAALAHERL